MKLRIETSFGPELVLTVPNGVDIPDWLLYLMERAGDEAHSLEQFRDWLIEGGFDEGRFPVVKSFTCPVCQMTSYNPNDVQYGYCGNCHKFTGGAQPAEFRPGIRGSVAHPPEGS